MRDRLIAIYTKRPLTRFAIYAAVSFLAFLYGAVNNIVLGRAVKAVSAEVTCLSILLTAVLPLAYAYRPWTRWLHTKSTAVQVLQRALQHVNGELETMRAEFVSTLART